MKFWNRLDPYTQALIVVTFYVTSLLFIWQS